MQVNELKIVLIGSSNVGKTCLASRAVTDTFAENTTPTLGSSYITKDYNINGGICRVQIWDTAGQERFRGITPMYYRNAGAAIIVYSVTDESSFNDIDEWYQSLVNFGEKAVDIYLVANKCDLEKTITTSQGEQKAQQIGAQYFEVSAFTGEGIDTLFDIIPRKYMETVHYTVSRRLTTKVKVNYNVSICEGKAKKKDDCC